MDSDKNMKVVENLVNNIENFVLKSRENYIKK
mgnify:CR=1 FL=1